MPYVRVDAAYPVSLNYYPVTEGAVPSADAAAPALSLHVSTSSQGCSPMADGALEVIVGHDVLDGTGGAAAAAAGSVTDSVTDGARGTATVVTLQPLEIRAFLLTLA